MRWRHNSRSVPVWVATWLVSSVGAVAMGSTMSEPEMGMVEPASYRSPSGACCLFVAPTGRHAHSSAMYRFSRSGAEVWSGKKPYTLRETVVTDKGVVAGFAYRTGSEDSESPREYLHIVILDEKGRETLNDVKERGKMRRDVVPPPPRTPFVQQFLVDTENDRLIVRVSTKGPDWYVYRLSTGSPLATLKLRDRLKLRRNPGFFHDVRIIPRSPLVLVHCCLGTPHDRDALFALLDEDYDLLWSFEVPNDYENVEWWRTGIVRHFREHPAILSVDEPNRFDLRLFAENKRVTFEITRDPNGRYVVTEVTRVDFLEQPPAEQKDIGDSQAGRAQPVGTDGR